MIEELRKLAKLYRMTDRKDLADKMLLLIAKESDSSITPKSDLSYSAIMRDLHKSDKEKMFIFMKSFKEAFDEAYTNDEEDIDQTALLQAMQEADYEA